ncbi:MAG TPA: GDYXXLXY domain-containing protein [Candidatus Paceibacterota bacterium]|nr:GDYXXLXY domain-containing protein [Verrucomicrobiota bacterium]HRY49065.1 GDYXXLXY domain-containing protein [Candidatus Paceibacterota bacterium]HRZ99155.1 GDYXXLXY domain-containing protein [Candidatus Paceibacterota bacterium]
MKHVMLAGIVGLQVLWILGTAFTQEIRLGTGTVIRLETRPVDPRDLLRGDYVILNYAINTVWKDRFVGPVPEEEQAPGKTVYVVLAPQGGFHAVTRISLTPLKPGVGEVMITGKIAKGRWESSGSFRIEYGIERYYVPEGTGNPRGKITVDVAVSWNGKTSIKQVYIDGRPYAEVMASQKTR